ncbi:MAG: hypothetical protein AVDCRST_MAG18-154 [uncultured Thermomicrobiales bacterium]|uniref:DUF402 domain-containing protein n=1 Tax=uncultured Thermomicrobiales bacterium TaxID=1645740 RepID=A0A6J4UFU8_9BACT|nr:MAG: hypothetical protein AVDCRST_MAG18-154 [uncultured Thermomicrobiales bacterium]
MKRIGGRSGLLVRHDGEIRLAQGEAGAGPTLLARGRRVTVRGIAPEGEERWSFAAEALADTGDEFILRVHEGEPVAGPEPWNWPAAGDLHLWRSRPYSILVTTRARRFPYWYCPIHTPARPEGDEIRVTDLGLDVQLFADGRYSIGGDPPDAARHPDLAAISAAAATELVELMTRKAPPFDGRSMPDAG